MPVEPTRLIELLVWEWIYKTLSIPQTSVFRTNQDGPTATGDFVTFNFINESQGDYVHTAKELIKTSVDPDPIAYDENELLVIITARVKVAIGIQIFSANARSLHKALVMSRNHRATRAIFSPYRSAFLYADIYSDQVFSGDTKTRPRVVGTYFFSTNAQATERNDRVHSFEINGQFLK